MDRGGESGAPRHALVDATGFLLDCRAVSQDGQSRKFPTSRRGSCLWKSACRAMDTMPNNCQTSHKLRVSPVYEPHGAVYMPVNHSGSLPQTVVDRLASPGHNRDIVVQAHAVWHTCEPQPCTRRLESH
jgi:hypothetical protein